MTTNIYILKLENNKYYIGKSDDIGKSYLEHINGTASYWTRKYKPFSINKIISNVTSSEEEKYIIEYMCIYGIDNVRGGLYVTEALDKLQRHTIRKSIWKINNCCIQCGRKGHSIKNCYATEDVNGDEICEDAYQLWQCRYCNNQYEDEIDCSKHEKNCQNKKIIKIKYN